MVTGDWVMELPESAAKLAIDLGEWWQNTYHLPFVYALWVYRNRTPGQDLGQELIPLLWRACSYSISFAWRTSWRPRGPRSACSSRSSRRSRSRSRSPASRSPILPALPSAPPRTGAR